MQTQAIKGKTGRRASLPAPTRLSKCSHLRRLRTASLFAIVLRVSWLEPRWLSEIGVLGAIPQMGAGSLSHGTVPVVGFTARVSHPFIIVNEMHIFSLAQGVGVTQLMSGSFSQNCSVGCIFGESLGECNSEVSCITILALSLFCIFNFSHSGILVF